MSNNNIFWLTSLAFSLIFLSIFYALPDQLLISGCSISSAVQVVSDISCAFKFGRMFPDVFAPLSLDIVSGPLASGCYKPKMWKTLDDKALEFQYLVPYALNVIDD